MPKYVLTWESDTSKSPADPQQRSQLIKQQLEKVMQWEKDHKGDWGVYVGENAGFGIIEGDWTEVMKVMMAFPTTHMKIHQALSAKEAYDFMQAAAQQVPKK